MQNEIITEKAFIEKLVDGLNEKFKDNDEVGSFDYKEIETSLGDTYQIVCNFNNEEKYSIGFIPTGDYNDYSFGRCSLNDVIDRNVYRVNQYLKDINSVDLSKLNDFDSFKEKIYIKLLGIDVPKNKKKLDEAINVEVAEGLYATFVVPLESIDKDADRCMVLTKRNSDIYGISTEEIYNIALINCIRDKKANVENLLSGLSFLRSHSNKSFEESLDDIPDKNSMTLLHYHDYSFGGATTILYPGILKRICEKLETRMLYIIPSSISEVILINANMIDENDATQLIETIKFVNDKEVPENEILSNNLYIYDLETNKISLFKGIVDEEVKDIEDLIF